MNLWVVAIKLFSPLFSSLKRGRKEFFLFFLSLLSYQLAGQHHIAQINFFEKNKKDYEGSNLPQDNTRGIGRGGP